MSASRDYFRGLGDARLFSSIKATAAGWVGELRRGDEAWIVQPVTDDYLRGLADGGCEVADATPAPCRAA